MSEIPCERAQIEVEQVANGIEMGSKLPRDEVIDEAPV